MSAQMMADDLFAGAGGWDLAAEALGIHARGVENMTEARLTRDAAGLTTIHDDVWTFTPDGRATGLIASPPCQTFSAAGKGSGRKALDDVLAVIASGDWHSLAKLKEAGLRFGDDRTALVLTPLHFATGYEYEWLAWEQVPTVLPVWEACAVVLREFGWHVWTGLLQAEMYGVPQTRKRAFLLASLNGPVDRPVPTHSRYYPRDPKRLDDDVLPWVSMAQALGWGLGERPSPTITGGGTETGGAEPIAKLARYTERDDFTAPAIAFGHDAASCRWTLGEAEWWGPGGVDPRRPATTVAGDPRITSRAHHEPGTQGRAPVASADVRASLEAGPEWAHNRPSTTIVGSFKPEIVAAPGYRTTVSRQDALNSVRVTIEEAGVLQTFPHDFPWQGAKGKQYLQCGNAVPPGLALHALSAAAVHHLAARGEAVA